MKYNIFLSDDAENDIALIYVYTESNFNSALASTTIEGIQKKYLSLDIMPNRGHVPAESSNINLKEISYKIYRIIYEIRDNDVMVHAVIDSHRDFKSLLYERLLLK